MPELDGVCIEHCADKHESSCVFVGMPPRVFTHDRASRHRQGRNFAEILPLENDECVVGEVGEYWRRPYQWTEQANPVDGANGPIHCSRIVVLLWDTRADSDPQRLLGLVVRGKNDGRICLLWPHQGCMRR